MCGMSIGLASQGFTESSGGQSNRGEWPCGRRLDEELRAVHEVSRNGAARIHATTRSVLINEANRDTVNAMLEPSDREAQPAKRVLTQRVRRIGPRATHVKVDLRIHRHLLECEYPSRGRAHIRTKRPLVVFRSTRREIK
jgi:hypothetical protein